MTSGAAAHLVALGGYASVDAVICALDLLLGALAALVLLAYSVRRRGRRSARGDDDA